MSPLFKAVITTHVALFRITGGRIGANAGKGRRLLLLTTTGRKTGLQRVVPVLYIEDDAGNPVVTASMGGQPQNPAWFDNLSANPEVSYQTGDQIVRARAVVAEPALRDALWVKLTTRHPHFLDYQKKTTRIIPMVVLKPLT